MDGLGGQRLLLPAHVGRVVAGPRRQAPAVQFHDSRREPLQKRAVVRHEDHGPGEVREEFLEPRDRVDVQMVGRLVEQEHVGLAHQRARQQDAPAPAARQRVDDRVGLQLQAGEHEVNMMIAQPRFVGFEMVCVSLSHDVEHRAVGRQRDVLVKARRAQCGLAPHGARVGRDLAAENLEQRRLARAVPAEDGNALARLDLQRHFVQQRHVAERHRHALARQQRHLPNVPRVAGHGGEA